MVFKYYLVMKAKEERMNKIKSATEQAHTLLGDDIFFTISDVAKVSKLSKSKIYEMKILPGQTNKTGDTIYSIQQRRQVSMLGMNY